MFKIFLRTLGIILLLAGADHASACKFKKTISVVGEAGNSSEITIDFDMLKDTTEWKVTSGGPPLDLSTAVSLALTHVHEKIGSSQNVRLESVSLESVGCTAAGAVRWYYVFEFVSGNGKSGSERPDNWVVISMDGTILNSMKAE